MAVTRSGKLRFTDEQYQRARYDSSALAYAQSQGYHLKQMGRHWQMVGHDSMIFTQDGRWFWNSRGVQGGAIEFLLHYEQKTLPEAVLILCDELEHQHTEVPRYAPAPSEPKPEFTVPKRSGDYKRLFGYLINGRGLDYDIVSELVQANCIYPSIYKTETSSLVNACFVGKDEQGTIKSAFLRGCHSNSTFKMEVPSSDKTYAFRLPCHEASTTLLVFEGAIDALSHATIQKMSQYDWKNCHRISQGGNAPIETITRYLDTHPHINEIYLCLDNDQGGEKIQAKIRQELEDTGYHQQIDTIQCPYGKDWNEYLVALRQQARASSEQDEEQDFEPSC